MSEAIVCTTCCSLASVAAITVCYLEDWRKAVEIDDDIRSFVRTATGGTFDPVDPIVMR